MYKLIIHEFLILQKHHILYPPKKFNMYIYVTIVIL